MAFHLADMLLPLQAGLAVAALAGVALAPPVSGRLLLVPLAGHDASIVARVALAGGAMLLGPGPLRGSLVVIGDRSAVARRIAGAGIVILAAPPAGCEPEEGWPA